MPKFVALRSLLFDFRGTDGRKFLFKLRSVCTCVYYGVKIQVFYIFSCNLSEACMLTAEFGEFEARTVTFTVSVLILIFVFRFPLNLMINNQNAVMLIAIVNDLQQMIFDVRIGFSVYIFFYINFGPK